MSAVTTDKWLIDERVEIDASLEREIQRGLPDVEETVKRGVGAVPPLALMLHDVVVYDVKKWFGEADVRLDALVVHGYGQKDEPESFYAPQTFRFSGIGDRAKLQIGESGLLLFHGRPLHFLDIFITLSRDTKDSDSLADLLKKQLGSQEVGGAIGTLAGLAVAAPQVALVTAAVGAAAILGDFAYRVIREAAGKSIGLYRTSYLQYRHHFGVGRHPEGGGSYRVDDFSFWYQIHAEKKAEAKAREATERDGTGEDLRLSVG
jgi:hypothetical protein